MVSDKIERGSVAGDDCDIEDMDAKNFLDEEVKAVSILPLHYLFENRSYLLG